MKKTGKNKHIGIYIHHQNKEHWLRFKDLLPHFSCRLTILSSLDIKSELDSACAFIKLPKPIAGKDVHKEKMSVLFDFVCKKRPDLFYINESVEVATLVNLLGVPYVYARMKDSKKNDMGHCLAYGQSLFNIAPYDNVHEEDWYKRTPFYHKTKYHLREQHEVNNKLFCMYLEDEVCLKREEALKPFLFKAFQ